MAPDDAAQAVLDYVHAVRTRWTAPIAPPGFAPDWADRPDPHTYYPQTERQPLPLHDPQVTAGDGRFDLPLLGSFLHLSAGVLSRRWQIDWSPDIAGATTLTGARWGRGTPSGGGAYPLELYMAAGPSAPMSSGIHHYASGLHALERVAAGNPVPEIAGALRPGRPEGTDAYLLCALRFWKSAYKYNNFAYHLMLHDLGAFLGSWGALGQQYGVVGDPCLAFDDRALARMLGLDPHEGGVLAVLPLSWADRPPGSPLRCDDHRARPVRSAPRERSRETREFPLVSAVHEATSGNLSLGTGQLDESLPDPPADAVPLDTSDSADSAAGLVPVADALARRASANGRFNGGRPMRSSDLGEALRAASHGLGGTRGGVRLRLAARRVAGLEAGVYDYHPERHALVPVADTTALGDRVYTLPNYSVGQAAVTVVSHWQPERAVARAGPRAYRYAAVAAGAAAQRLQLAATRGGLASGIVLGFQGPVLEDAIGLTAEGRHGLLCVFMGHHQEGIARLDDRLY